MRSALKLLLGLVLVPCALAALFVWAFGDDSGIAFDLSGWAELLPFALVPIVIALGLVTVAVSQVRARRGHKRDL